MDTEIDITGAINKRLKEIERIKSLRLDMQNLIDDSLSAERGKNCLPQAEWETLRKKVEDEMWDLGLARIVSVMGTMPIPVGVPRHWSNGKIR